MTRRSVHNLPVRCPDRRHHTLCELDGAVFVKGRGLLHVIQLLSSAGQGGFLLLVAGIVVYSKGAHQSFASVVLAYSLFYKVVLALPVENLRPIL